ncbi:MAG: cryptochrome/photolyase family protein [Coraliomargaritaceae bacterium]
MQSSPTIVWFRNDLRLSDNIALAEAIRVGAPILLLYIHDPEAEGAWALGEASNWWLHHALESLGADLAELGGALVLRKGDTLSQLLECVQASGATRIYWNRRYEGPLRELDARLKRNFTDAGLEVKSFNSSLLNEPHTVSTKAGKPCKVYTPYFKNVKERPVEPPVEPSLDSICFMEKLPQSESLESLDLMPDKDWHLEFSKYWQPTEAAAHERLELFLSNRVLGYNEQRDIPSVEGTSSLSPYLRFGQIGPRQVVHALKQKADLSAEGPFIYLKEIYWREFAYNVLYHFPDTPDRPLQPAYSDFPWEPDPVVLRAWKKGQTGYPIVDAGMRQLWQTGWMHNRVRMIVASLLVKHLLQDWREGARWFWDTLVDADLASNTLGWQWSGGCGADAAPYFRVFNPMTQGQKFDPEGSYVKHFVPELAALPAKYVHAPWEAPDGLLQNAGIVLGETYPLPVIEHAAGRARALDAFSRFREGPVTA